MAVAENITMASHGRWFKGGFLRGGIETEAARGFVEALDIKLSSPAAPGGSLSGGNQQKVSVARWLATQPTLLILDEPTQGVDVGAKGEIHRIVRELAKEGLAVLMISSDLPEIIGMSDRVGVMREGRLVEIFEHADAELVMAAALGSGEVKR
jgi:rhamnose transport system ATP-binding protein